MDIVIIGNPISSGGDAARRMTDLSELLKARGHTVDTTLTRYAGDGRDRIAALSENKDRIVVVGGDGTFNEIISGLPDHSTVPVLHFPTGNANLLAKDLKLPARTDKVAELLETGKTIYADVGVMNGLKFIMVAGMGFDARVTEEVKKVRTGKVSNLTYVLPMVKALFSSNGATYNVSVDGGRALTRGKAVIIANVRNYAGICEIAYQAGINTGCLDIVVLPEESVLAVLKYLMFAKFLRIDLLKSVTYLKGTTVRIESDRPIPVELDGDFNGRHSAVDISVIPASVPLIVP